MSDSDSSDENTPVKKTNPNRRPRGLASRLKLQNSEIPSDLTAQETAIYSTQVNKCFSSKSGSIPLNHELITNQVSNGSDVEEETGSILSCKQRKISTRQTRHVDDDLFILDEDDLICTSPSTTTPVVPLKSPSPPPGPPSPPRAMVHAEQARRKPRMTKAVKEALCNLSQTKTQLHVNRSTESELNTSDVTICTDTEDDVLMLKVKHGTDTYRLPVMENDFFKQILTNLSQRLEVAESQILLIHNDVTISPGDTPRSLGLTTADIIDCHINREEWTAPATDFNDSLDDINRITLYIQIRNDRHKMEFKLDKTSPLDGLIHQYATKTGKDPSNLRLMFDGESVDLRDSADNLEIEDGYTLDLIQVM
ncbi:NFATC2-interacting protein-like [Mizuhopecten yessoensis]|uniref:NFATC2-interacting protein n=1 Tax=Mizuhopecten yessoensis TaxID=6573 RepID=A0A210Q6B6_MIZYE|nr:NFATC2-interacting protein-like [Mizuhopecten yessoensis]OWF44280.1 NFATC2-interacting protein [Mizuhopecten yessoensis]